MQNIKIIAIVGSLRKKSYNRQLAIEAGEILKDYVDFEILDYEDIPFFNQDIEFPAPEAVMRVRKNVQSADGVWFFSPEYNHFFSGVLKNLIDWLSRPISENEPQVLKNKPVALSGVTPGMTGTAIAQDHLITLISFLNMRIMNHPRLLIPNVLQQTDSESSLTLTLSKKYLEDQAKAFLDFIRS
ncbi:MAG: NAD(P)H-dependent oxidoreductase [Candidatus Cloacimonetes bacterium]|nr:NAD(P)H-dependent oxidoreductase [Candidatus Cloacimonadota bacterium]